MKVFIGMECSGVIRRAFAVRGHWVVSADTKPAEDGVGMESNRAYDQSHYQGDVFDALDYMARDDWFPHLAIFHPDCTYLTNAAAWAFKDPDFDRYPGIGYHQKPRPETLTGQARRIARLEAVGQCKRILSLPIPRIALENPNGHLSSAIRKPDQIIQPWQYGHDASKATCLWLEGLTPLKPTLYIPPRIVNGRELWANQTDTGQNKLAPSSNRAADRARTYEGVGNAMANQWGM